MAKKTFELGDVLKDVLKPDTGAQEQIVYIELDRIDVDPGNFYSIEGVDDLAANIVTVGLQQPLRVRPNPEQPGRWLTVSGHRRRLALLKLRDDEPERWSSVPCIIEPAAASPELQELRLIFANADTRKMSSFDQAKQAERVEMLLYKLQEQGYEFPGRMRDHVAAACKVSATKLAVLKVIREKLIKPWAEIWERGNIPEATAYVLAKESAEIQKQAHQFCADPKKWQQWRFERLILDLKKAPKRTCSMCPGGKCDHVWQMLYVEYKEGVGYSCTSHQCCETCYNFEKCTFSCPLLDAMKKKRKEDQKNKRKKELAQEKARDQALIDTACRCWDRFALLRARAGISVKDSLERSGRSYCKGWHDDRFKGYETGEKKPTPGMDLPFANIHADDVQAIVKSAEMLGCSTDYLLGADDKPRRETGLISVDDHYPDEGAFVIAYTKDLVAIPSVYFRAAFMDCTEKSIANNRLTGIEYWSPRPQLPAGKKWPGQETIEGMVKG